MTYKPGFISSSFSGITGIGIIKRTADKKYLKIKLVETGKVYTIKYSKDTVPNKNVPEGKWMVTINNDGSKLMGQRPILGMFQAHVLKFTAQEGQPPTPRTSNGEFPFQYFTVLLELTSPEVKGMIVPFSPRYNFGEREENGKSVTWLTHPKSKYTPLLSDFLDATGTWERGPIMYKDNILPTLEKRILKEDRTFSIVMKDGWVVSIMADSAEETEVDDDEDTTTEEGEIPWDAETDEEDATTEEDAETSTDEDTETDEEE